MMKRNMILFLTVWLAIFAPSCALGQVFLMDDAREYTFGGSGTDQLEYLAVGADGRMVMTGSSYSSDGALTGAPERDSGDRCGWATCIDAQGSTLWTFVTNVCDLEELRFPVLHEDGSVTMVLEARHEDYIDDCMLIRLDRSGQVLHSAVMTSERLTQNVVYRALDTGYEVFVNHAAKPVYHLFDWDGQLLSTRDAMSEPTPSTEVFALKAGGAVGLSNQNLGKKYEPNWEGRVQLWDAEDRMISDVRIPGALLTDVVETRGGFVVVGRKGNESGWRLFAFNDAGEWTDSCDIGTSSIGAFCAAELPDGSIVCVWNEQKDPEDVHSDDDAHVMIIPLG